MHNLTYNKHTKIILINQNTIFLDEMETFHVIMNWKEEREHRVITGKKKSHM